MVVLYLLLLLFLRPAKFSYRDLRKNMKRFVIVFAFGIAAAISQYGAQMAQKSGT